jgi:hypothetical protein
MIRDLFEEDVRDMRLAPEAKLLGGFGNGDNGFQSTNSISRFRSSPRLQGERTQIDPQPDERRQ